MLNITSPPPQILALPGVTLDNGHGQVTQWLVVLECCLPAVLQSRYTIVRPKAAWADSNLEGFAEAINNLRRQATVVTIIIKASL